MKHQTSVSQDAFWNRTWKEVDRNRLADYFACTDQTADPITDFLTARGVETVCDAGCGCGAYARMLARHGFTVSGFDLSADAASMAQALLSEDGVTDSVFLVSDIRETPYPDGRFDAVVARDVLDHMPMAETAAALRELLRITRSGGCVVLTLDALDAEYEMQPHILSPDGDLLFTNGKWAGMVFHPWSADDLGLLAQGHPFEILNATDGLTVAVAKE